MCCLKERTDIAAGLLKGDAGSGGKIIKAWLRAIQGIPMSDLKDIFHSKDSAHLLAKLV